MSDCSASVTSRCSAKSAFVDSRVSESLLEVSVAVFLYSAASCSILVLSCSALVLASTSLAALALASASLALASEA